MAEPPGHYTLVEGGLPLSGRAQRPAHRGGVACWLATMALQPPPFSPIIGPQRRFGFCR